MMRRFWSASGGAACCAFLPLLLAGCSRGHPQTIAVVPQTTAQEIWESEHAGVAKALLGTRWKERWNGPSRETEVDRQIALVQQAIRQRDGGLILSPDHPVALTTAVRMAAEQGMPVVIVDATLNLPPSLDVDYLLNDEQQTGALAADRIGTVLRGHGTVAVLGETPALMGTVARDEAFRQSMAARYPAITVLDPLPGRFRTNLAEQDTEELLASHPELNAIFTLTVGATRGVYRGLKLKQRIHQVHLVACDQDLDLLYYLRLGEIDSLLAENTFAMGYRATRLITEHRAGMTLDGTQGRVLRFAPRLVTRDNVDTPEVQQILNMDWRPTQ
ncbi:MAG: ribose transport system substrate-binding protein [Acidobacteriaceae bacterium]|nr:ribose transport system substrate-binding protein [Acidobacteriaceae bacterium]